MIGYLLFNAEKFTVTKKDIRLCAVSKFPNEWNGRY